MNQRILNPPGIRSLSCLFLVFRDKFSLLYVVFNAIHFPTKAVQYLKIYVYTYTYICVCKYTYMYVHRYVRILRQDYAMLFGLV